MTIKKAKNGLSLEFLNMKLEYGIPARTLAAMALLGVRYQPKQVPELLTKASYKEIIDAVKEQILDEGMGATWEKFSDACTYNNFTEEMLETLSKRMVILSKGVLSYDYLKEAE